MLKKSLASLISCAVLSAGPGDHVLTASAQTMARGPVTGVSVTPMIATGLSSPIPGASSLNIPSLPAGALVAPTLTVAPAVAAPIAAAAGKAMPATGSPLSVIVSQDASVGVSERGAALNALFENSTLPGHGAIGVLGRSAASADTELPSLEPAIGMKMTDGSYFVGISPDTNLPMYAAPSNAPRLMNYDNAAKYARDLEVGGKKGFRVPSLAELYVLRKAIFMNEELRKTFYLVGTQPDGWYHSSSQDIPELITAIDEWGEKYAPFAQGPTYQKSMRLIDGDARLWTMAILFQVRPVRS